MNLVLMASIKWLAIKAAPLGLGLVPSSEKPPNGGKILAVMGDPLIFAPLAAISLKIALISTSASFSL